MRMPFSRTAHDSNLEFEGTILDPKLVISGNYSQKLKLFNGEIVGGEEHRNNVRVQN